MKKMNVNKELVSMIELENVNGGVGCKKKFDITRNGKDDWDW